MSIKSIWNEHRVLSIIVIIVALAFIYTNYIKTSFSSATGGTISFSETAVNSNYAEGIGGVAFDSVASDKSIGRLAAPSFSSPSPGGQPFGSGDGIEVDEKVIKTANITMEVESVLTAIPAIENITKNLKGIIVNSNSSEDTAGIKRGSITVKVPVTTFNQARAEIKGVGVFIRNESTNARDVTEEFVDIEAQLINLRAQESTYRTLLNRSIKIEDIIKITSSLTSVRTQIERIEGRKRFLTGQTDFSTISVSLFEDSEIAVPSRKWRPLTVLKDATRNTIDQLQGFVDNSIEFVFWALGIIPYLIMVAVLYWIARRMRR